MLYFSIQTVDILY